MQLTDIKKVIKDGLNTAFDIGIIDSNIKENIPRPSFKVQLAALKSTPGKSDTVDKIVSIKLEYLCTDPQVYDLEQMEIRDKLSNLFSSIVMIGDDVIKFREYKDSVIDDLVKASFEVEYVSLINNELEYADMEYLSFKMKEGA